jgi:hypothetical protein
MTTPTQHGVSHLRDGLIVAKVGIAKVGIVRSTTASAHFHRTETSRTEVE